MPMAIGEAEIGPENAELVASRTLVGPRAGQHANRSRRRPAAARLYAGKADGKPVELLVDADGTIRRGKCLCGHHHKAGIRMGPCRHLLALRQDGPAWRSEE